MSLISLFFAVIFNKIISSIGEVWRKRLEVGTKQGGRLLQADGRNHSRSVSLQYVLPSSDTRFSVLDYYTFPMSYWSPREPWQDVMCYTCIALAT